MSLIKQVLATTALLGLFAIPASAEIVPVGHFDKIGLEGGGHILVKYGPTQRVTILKGSTQYTTFTIREGNHLEIKACNRDCPHIYDLEIEIVTPNLDSAAIEGGGHIVAASGFPSQDSFDAAVDGGGHIEMQALSANRVEAAVDGGGHIEVTAKRTLHAAVDGGGSITYHGDPQVSSAIDGGGSVSKAAR
jgi:hypothetical protein